MEIKDNTFSRQFEILATEGVITVEYSLQERKIFLTRINTPEHFDNEPYLDEIIRQILTIAEEKKWRVVPIFPRIAKLFQKESGLQKYATSWHPNLNISKVLFLKYLYFYGMSPEENNHHILEFFEAIEKYYGCKTELTEGICCSSGDFNAEFTTWNLFEFELVRSAYRNIGDRFMMEGAGMYYEIDAKSIVSLTQPGRNKFEFIEKLGDNIYRITKLRFHYKY